MSDKPQKTRPKAVIFDVDGTLLDTIPDIARIFNAVLEKKGFPKHAAEAYRGFVGGGLRNTLAAALPPDVPADDEAMQSMLDEIRGSYAEHPVEATVPYPGIPELLAALAEREVPMGILSNKDHHLTEKVINMCFPHIPFRVVMGKMERYQLKPDPESAEFIVKELGYHPKETAMAGDSLPDYHTAINTGMIPLIVTWGFTDRHLLKKAGCDILIETVAELRTVLLEEGGLIHHESERD